MMRLTVVRLHMVLARPISHFQGYITFDATTLDPASSPPPSSCARHDHAVITRAMKQKQHGLLKRSKTQESRVMQPLRLLTSSRRLASRDTLVCRQFILKSVHENVSRVVVPVLVFGACTGFKKLDVLPPLWIPTSIVPAQNAHNLAVLYNNILGAEFTVSETHCIVRLEVARDGSGDGCWNRCNKRRCQESDKLSTGGLWTNGPVCLMDMSIQNQGIRACKGRSQYMSLDLWGSCTAILRHAQAHLVKYAAQLARIRVF